MPEINVAFKPLLRETRCQGVFECFLVVSALSVALYLYTENLSDILRCVLSFILILLNLYDYGSPAFAKFLEKTYWIALIPALYGIGFAWSPLLLYVSMQVHLYFRMMGGMSKSFTAGELFLNSHILITLFEYSLNPKDLSMAIIFFPVKLTIGFSLLYAVVSKIAGRGNYSTIYFSLISFSLTSVLTLGILAYQCYQHYGELGLIYEHVYQLMFGSTRKILLITYWTLLIIASVASFYGLKHSLKLGLISSRKLFHVLTLILFVPGFVYSVILLILLVFMK